MKKTQCSMGMPVTIEVLDTSITGKIIDEIFDYFMYIDETFSTYKVTSEISQINNGLLEKSNYSSDMLEVLSLCEQTKRETHGYFDIYHEGKYDPSGLVKGWSIYQATKLLQKKGFTNFYIDAGGDIQVTGKNKKGDNWIVGIRNPFKREEIVKRLSIDNKGVATSGTYIRGNHIYDPFQQGKTTQQPFISVTVIGPNIYEADRFATAAFAMGEKGVYFLESLKGFEGYVIDKAGKATYTSGFEKFVL